MTDFKIISISLFVASQWFVLCKQADVFTPLNSQYAAVIDAGSSGSRIRLYRWLIRRRAVTLPDITEVFSYKKTPGCSDFVDDLPALTEYLGEMIQRVVDVIPRSLFPRSDVYFMATAGMRLLLEGRANIVVELVDRVLTNKTINPLKYMSPDNTRILSGEEEGVFSWITVNYLTGAFNKKDRPVTIGMMEMGGASTQIVFEHGGNILADKFPVTINNRNYQLYAHSYLYYGQNYAVQWVMEELYKSSMSDQYIDNPCMLINDVASHTIDGKVIRFRGTGRPDECLIYVNRLIYKSRATDWQCNPKPCAIGTTYQPTIRPSTKFIAVGAFSYSINQVGALASDGGFTPLTVQQAGFQYCLSDYKNISTADQDQNRFLSTYCFMSLYIPQLFTRGYGFSNDTKQIVSTMHLAGQPAEWPLGAIIYELERKFTTICDNLLSSTSSNYKNTLRFNLRSLLCLMALYQWRTGVI